MSSIDVAETQKTAEAKAKQLPDPVGYKLLCMVPNVEDTYDGGIIKADETVRTEEQTTVVLFVVKVGSGAYKDPVHFPDGAWCAPGDFVLVRTYAGTRIKIHGTEFRVINDDTVEAIVQDPRGISRA